MIRSRQRSGPMAIAIELVAFLGIVVGFIDLCHVFRINGYLPAPFVFDVSDTFMDWFNTAYWSHHPGAYDVWNTIYAPLSFVITRLLGDPRCYANAPLDARDCDIVGLIAIPLIFLACVVLSGVAFYRRDRATALFRTTGIAIGGPMLFALERGNLIMIAYFAFVLIYGDFLKSRSAFAATAAAMINLKSYLLFPLMALAVKRQWRLLEVCGIATLAIYLLTLFLVNEGTPFQIVHNLQVWFDLRAGTIWDEVLYSTTYKPYLQFDVRGYPIRDFVPQRTIDIASTAIWIEVALSRGMAILCIAGAWFYPKAVATSRVAFFILMQSFMNQNPGGYAIAFIVFLVFLEDMKNVRVALAVVGCYLVSIPTDINITTFYEYEREAWLSGRLVNSAYALPLGAIVRPGILVVVLWSLAIDTLIDLHRAIRGGQPSLGFGPPAPSTLPAVA